jgi:hypothetical protein
MSFFSLFDVALELDQVWRFGQDLGADVAHADRDGVDDLQLLGEVLVQDLLQLVVGQGVVVDAEEALEELIHVSFRTGTPFLVLGSSSSQS